MLCCPFGNRFLVYFICDKDNFVVSRAPRAQPSLDLQGGSERLSHLPIRDPSQLVVGAPNTLHTTWKHHPNALVSASVQYIAQVSCQAMG